MTTLGLITLVTGCGNTTQSPAAVLARSAARGTEAYVANFGYDDQPGTTVTAVDLATGRVSRSVTTGSLPSALAATPDGRLLLVTDQGDDNLAVLSATTDQLMVHIPTGVEPDAVAVSPDGTLALVANVDDNTVTPIDLATLRAGRPIPVGARPDAVVIGGPGGRTALVANLEGNTVTPVNLATMTPGTPIPTGGEPDALALTPDGSTALVANLGSGTVTPVDMATLRPGLPVAVGPGPTGVAVTSSGPGGQPTAWVTAGDDIVPLKLSNLSLLLPLSVGTPVPVGHLAEALAITTDGTTAWVAGQDATLTPVDLATGVRGPTIDVGGRPAAVIIPPPRH